MTRQFLIKSYTFSFYTNPRAGVFHSTCTECPGRYYYYYTVIGSLDSVQLPSFLFKKKEKKKRTVDTNDSLVTIARTRHTLQSGPFILRQINFYPKLTFTPPPPTHTLFHSKVFVDISAEKPHPKFKSLSLSFPLPLWFVVLLRVCVYTSLYTVSDSLDRLKVCCLTRE